VYTRRLLELKPEDVNRESNLSKATDTLSEFSQTRQHISCCLFIVTTVIARRYVVAFTAHHINRPLFVVAFTDATTYVTDVCSSCSLISTFILSGWNVMSRLLIHTNSAAEPESLCSLTITTLVAVVASAEPFVVATAQGLVVHNPRVR